MTTAPGVAKPDLPCRGAPAHPALLAPATDAASKHSTLSDAACPARGPLLPLPGFMPDAVTFASRLTLAMLLAYLIAFTLQLDTASSAGVCVAVVMQPTPGMAMSKAFYRIVGTVVGGVTALVLVAAFPQDRTMLLAAFTVWMGLCSYVATVLRDSRSYGAVLSGYTVAIIAITGIDQPDGALLATLNRVAAILIGVVCVALVNSVFTVDTAHQNLMDQLSRQLRELQAMAREMLGDGQGPGDKAYLQRVSDLLLLRSEASYATAERAGGLQRGRAADCAIVALLEMLAAIRGIGQPAGLAQGARRCFDEALISVRDGKAAAPPGRLPTEPFDAMLVERAMTLADAQIQAQAWIRAVETGFMDRALHQVRFRTAPDHVVALQNAARTMIAVSLGAVFCVLGDDSSVTLVLVQQAALVGLLALQPDPSKSSLNFLAAVPVSALLTGVVSFLLLPMASGFLLFALAVGPCVFLLGLAQRHKLTVRFGPALAVIFVLLLSPSNTESFDLSTFLNQSLHVILDVTFVVIAFYLILPVRPGQRLFRVMDKIAQSLRRTMHRGALLQQPGLQLVAFDRLSQALVWTQLHSRLRQAVVGRMIGFTDLDAALFRAWSGLHEVMEAAPGFEAAVRIGRTGLAGAEPDLLEQSARALLSGPTHDPASGMAVLRAVSGLYASKLLLVQQDRALRRYGVLEG